MENVLELVYNYARSNYGVKTYGEFAKMIGVTQETLSRWLAGKQSIPESRLKRINSIFDNVFSMKWLLTGEGDMLNTNIAIGDANTQVSGNHNKVGIPTKNFEHEEKWFALMAEKDKQIDRLLSIIERITK